MQVDGLITIQSSFDPETTLQKLEAILHAKGLIVFATVDHAAGAAQLHRELHLRPWQESPLFAMGECPWPPSCGGARTWADSVALRRELLDAH